MSAAVLLAALLAARAQEVEPPQIIRSASPEVPPEQAAVRGTVLLELSLDETGKPYAIRVLEGLDPMLDARSVEAARALRFSPAVVGERAVPSTVQWAYTFEGLADGGASDLSLVVVDEEPWQEHERAPNTPPEGATLGEWVSTRRDVELTPGALSDPMRAMVEQPGVTRRSFLYGGSLSVRGGAYGETLYLIDGVPIDRVAAMSLLSVFNPTLTERVTLYSIAPPVSVPESLSGAMSVDYLTPRDTQWDGTVEITALSGSAQVAGPLGRGQGGSFVAAARTMTLAPYMALVKSLGFLRADESWALGYSDAFARASWDVGNTGRHELSLSGLMTRDLNDYQSTGTRNLEQISSQLGSLRYRFTPSPSLSWDTTLAVTRSETTLAVTATGADFSVDRLRPFLRSVLRWEADPVHTLSGGVDAAAYQLGHSGAVIDDRSRPVWLSGGFAGSWPRDPLEIEQDQRWGELGVFAEHAATALAGLPLDTRLGVRLTPLHNGADPLVSPRAAVAVRLPSETTLKGFAGISHQLVRDPLALDAQIGATEATPARARQASVAIEQALGALTLLRIEGYGRLYDGLMVYPDDPAALDAGARYEAVGTGESLGIDVLLRHRRERWGASLAYSGQDNTRTNPLHTEGPQTYAPYWSVPHSATLAADTELGQRRRWTVAGNLIWQAGTPRTPLQHRWDPSGGVWTSYYYDYNSIQNEPTLAGAVRFERRAVAFRGRVKMSLYLDLVNVRLDRNLTTMRYYTDAESGEFDDPTSPPVASPSAGLPPLPWLGLRAEF